MFGPDQLDVPLRGVTADGPARHQVLVVDRRVGAGQGRGQAHLVAELVSAIHHHQDLKHYVPLILSAAAELELLAKHATDTCASTRQKKNVN